MLHRRQSLAPSAGCGTTMPFALPISIQSLSCAGAPSSNWHADAASAPACEGRQDEARVSSVLASRLVEFIRDAEQRGVLGVRRAFLHRGASSAPRTARR